jgi:hypothetical protein
MGRMSQPQCVCACVCVYACVCTCGVCVRVCMCVFVRVVVAHNKAQPRFARRPVLTMLACARALLTRAFPAPPKQVAEFSADPLCQPGPMRVSTAFQYDKARAVVERMAPRFVLPVYCEHAKGDAIARWEVRRRRLRCCRPRRGPPSRRRPWRCPPRRPRALRPALAPGRHQPTRGAWDRGRRCRGRQPLNDGDTAADPTSARCLQESREFCATVTSEDVTWHAPEGAGGGVD